MSSTNTNKRVTLDFPSELYRMVKAFAAFNDLSIKSFIVDAVNKELDKSRASGGLFSNVGSNKKEYEESSSAFLSSSNQSFSDEWNSKEDDEAFTELQKYKPRKN